MPRTKYAVDGPAGYTAEFVFDGTARHDLAAIVAEAERIVRERFPIREGRFEIWDVEDDRHVAGFSVEP